MIIWLTSWNKLWKEQPKRETLETFREEELKGKSIMSDWRPRIAIIINILYFMKDMKRWWEEDRDKDTNTEYPKDRSVRRSFESERKRETCVSGHYHFRSNPNDWQRRKTKHRWCIDSIDSFTTQNRIRDLRWKVSDWQRLERSKGMMVSSLTSLCESVKETSVLDIIIRFTLSSPVFLRSCLIHLLSVCMNSTAFWCREGIDTIDCMTWEKEKQADQKMTEHDKAEASDFKKSLLRTCSPSSPSLSDSEWILLHFVFAFTTNFSFSSLTPLWDWFKTRKWEIVSDDVWCEFGGTTRIPRTMNGHHHHWYLTQASSGNKKDREHPSSWNPSSDESVSLDLPVSVFLPPFSWNERAL